MAFFNDPDFFRKQTWFTLAGLALLAAATQLELMAAAGSKLYTAHFFVFSVEGGAHFVQELAGVVPSLVWATRGLWGLALALGLLSLGVFKQRGRAAQLVRLAGLGAVLTLGAALAHAANIGSIEPGIGAFLLLGAGILFILAAQAYKQDDQRVRAASRFR